VRRTPYAALSNKRYHCIAAGGDMVTAVHADGAYAGGKISAGCLVCLSVCLFLCSHNNFRATQGRMMKLGRQAHCTKCWLEFECQGQRSSSLGTKTRRPASADRTARRQFQAELRGDV